MRRVICAVLISAVVLLNMNTIACAAEVSLSAQAYVLYCVQNKEVLLGHNADKRMKPASTTKIMTTLLALEKCEQNDPLVTFTDEMIAQGSSMYLKTGDTVHLSDLAVGMMMASGNDAANATAVSLAGSSEDFSQMMNKRAALIGMNNTHFVTPSGLDDDNHYSTALDLAKLMGEAMNNERFAEITKNKSMTVNFLTPVKQVTYENHNRLLSLYEYCTGGKTGYTKSAGRCLVTSAEKNGVTLVAVTLNAPDDWNDHIKLYEYGFEKYAVVDTDDSDAHFKVDVVGSDVNEVGLYCKHTDTAVIDAQDKGRVKRTVYIPSFLYAPVRIDDCVGMVTYTLDDRVIAQNPIYVSADVNRTEENIIKSFLRMLF